MTVPQMTRANVFIGLTSRALLVLLVGVAACGCDKAKEPYEECVKLEAAEKIIEAREACEAALKADPSSDSGEAAKGKLEGYMREQADKALAEKAKANRPCPSHKWVTHCMWKGEPRPDLLEAETKAACDSEAHQVSVIGMTCPACECKDYFEDPYAEK